MSLMAYMSPFELVSPQLIHQLTVALLIALLILNLISLLGRHVYLELATHFRLQYALASLACILLFTVFHSWWLLPLALAVALFNLSYILHYYFAPPRTQEALASTVDLRLMQANLLWSNGNYAALREAVHEAHPDILVLQELTEEWLDQTQGFVASYPYYKTVPRPAGAGMALFSRYPLEAAAVLTLDASTHTALLAQLNIEGAAVSLLCLHPPTPVSPDKFLNRNRQFTEAASILRSAKGHGILIGDLNTTMWSPYFKRLARDSGLRDARLGFGLRPSWPLPLPAFLQLPIDHCLVSDGVSVSGISTGRRTGSDHRPLIVDLQLQGPA
jgi:endonuclease/exonuclease/phosphatase (EEP) superfamily protein YafD